MAIKKASVAFILDLDSVYAPVSSGNFWIDLGSSSYIYGGRQ